MRILLYGSLPTHSLSCCCFLGPSPHDPPLKVKVAGGIEASKTPVTETAPFLGMCFMAGTHRALTCTKLSNPWRPQMHEGGHLAGTLGAALSTGDGSEQMHRNFCPWTSHSLGDTDNK